MRFVASPSVALPCKLCKPDPGPAFANNSALRSDPRYAVAFCRRHEAKVSALKSIELLVLDEADRLLDPSFVHKARVQFDWTTQFGKGSRML